MTGRAVRRIEVRAASGSREALVRCAVTMIAERIGATADAPGPAISASPAHPPSTTLRVVRLERPGACWIEASGDGIDRAIDEARAALGPAVTIRIDDGWDPNESTGAPGGSRPGADGWDPKQFEGGLGAGEGDAWLAGFATEAIDHTADEAFAVTAADRADLLAAAAEALGGLIASPRGVRIAESRAISVSAPEEAWADDDRMFAWLAEVLFVLDTSRVALRRAVVLEDDDRGVRGAIFGEPLDADRHAIRGGIKAVTYHGLTLEETPAGLRATIVVDV